MRRALALLLLAALAVPWAGPARAQDPKMVKVVVDFRQTGTRSRDAVEGSGRVVITERGSARPSGRVGVDSTETRVRQSTGIFTLVQDGGESTLTVATQVPYSQVTFYRDYATGAGYLAAGVAFKDVGTALKVRVTLLPGNRIRVRLTPTLSYFNPDGTGAIELTEAATELVVASGRAVVIGGGTTQTNEVTRQILGYRAAQSGSETIVTLTATIQK